jgi:hypothetical protein
VPQAAGELAFDVYSSEKARSGVPRFSAPRRPRSALLTSCSTDGRAGARCGRSRCGEPWRHALCARGRCRAPRRVCATSRDGWQRTVPGSAIEFVPTLDDEVAPCPCSITSTRWSPRTSTSGSWMTARTSTGLQSSLRLPPCSRPSPEASRCHSRRVDPASCGRKNGEPADGRSVACRDTAPRDLILAAHERRPGRSKPVTGSPSLDGDAKLRAHRETPAPRTAPLSASARDRQHPAHPGGPRRSCPGSTSATHLPSVWRSVRPSPSASSAPRCAPTECVRILLRGATLHT